VINEGEAFIRKGGVMRVLIAEDDKPVASFVQKGLEAEQYAVDIAQDGDEAQLMVNQCEYDVAVLDLTLPRADGLEVLKYIRENKPTLPVLILTGRNRVEDRVKGLDLGADDYLTKPFSFSELSARVRALLRRSTLPLEIVLRVADLELNRVERTAKRAAKTIELTPKEFALLEYLMRNVGKCVTRTMIIEHVWNLSFDTMTNVVDVYINYLRKKVDHGSERKLIHTIRGVGYQIGEEV
jgi:two-component system copper resistance phosphate regulon response regulator CusR